MCRGCDGCCVFCLYYERGAVGACVCLCLVCILWQFCITCSLLMLVEDARGILHSRFHNCLVEVDMSVSFCLPHPVAVSAFMICRGLCACTEMLWMCVLFVSFGSKVRHRTCGCVELGSALLFIFRSRLLVYSAGSGVNRVQGPVVNRVQGSVSGFSMRLFCFVQAKSVCR